MSIDMSKIVNTKLHIYESYDAGRITENEKYELLDILETSYIDDITNDLYDELLEEYCSDTISDDDFIEILTESEEVSDDDNEKEDDKNTKKEELKRKAKIIAKSAAIGGTIAAGAYGLYKHADNYNNKRIKNIDNVINTTKAKLNEVKKDRHDAKLKGDTHYNKAAAKIDVTKCKAIKDLDEDMKSFIKECKEKKEKIKALKGRVNPKTGKEFNYDKHKDELIKYYHDGIDKLKRQRQELSDEYINKKLNDISTDHMTYNNMIKNKYQQQIDSLEKDIGKYTARKSDLEHLSATKKIKNVVKHDVSSVKKVGTGIVKTGKGAVKATQIATAPLRKIADMDNKKKS